MNSKTFHKRQLCPGAMDWAQITEKYFGGKVWGWKCPTCEKELPSHKDPMHHTPLKENTNAKKLKHVLVRTECLQEISDAMNACEKKTFNESCEAFFDWIEEHFPCKVKLSSDFLQDVILTNQWIIVNGILVDEEKLLAMRAQKR